MTGSFVSPLDGTDTKLQREEAIEWLSVRPVILSQRNERTGTFERAAVWCVLKVEAYECVRKTYGGRVQATSELCQFTF